MYSTPYQGGVTALHIACYKGLINIMKHMVPPLSWKNGSRVNVNVKDEVRELYDIILLYYYNILATSKCPPHSGASCNNLKITNSVA